MEENESNGDDSQCPAVLMCTVCMKQMRNPHILPCLHAFCLPCLQDECSQRSKDKFFCPLCVDPNVSTVFETQNGEFTSGSALLENGVDSLISKKSVSSRPWHSFDKILENEAEHDALQRRLAEIPASERMRDNDMDDEDFGDDDIEAKEGVLDASNGKPSRRASHLFGTAAMFPCTNHSDRLSDQYCTKCEQIACSRCVTSFHRRCPQGSIQDIKDAVDSKRQGFDSLHNLLAGSLALCEDVQSTQASRASVVEQARARLLLEIKAARETLIRAIFAKEKALCDEVNNLMNGFKEDADCKATISQRLATSLGRQLDIMSLSLGASTEGELLPYLPGVEKLTQAQAELAAGPLMEASSTSGAPTTSAELVTFLRDEAIQAAVTASPLGTLQMENSESVGGIDGNSGGDARGGDGRLALRLILETSFHGGARDDATDPLLTDLVLLTNGDVILTDRDNHCVKKFNRHGKLLTRVMLGASPSRIAIVSHGRAVVCTTNRRALYFLSLQGTVRILSSVKVRKLYSFLTWLGGGILAAGTSHGDCVDLITEAGHHVKTIYSTKSIRADISRPFYITPVAPEQSASSVKSIHTNLNSSQRQMPDKHQSLEPVRENRHDSLEDNNNHNNNNVSQNHHRKGSQKPRPHSSFPSPPVVKEANSNQSKNTPLYILGGSLNTHPSTDSTQSKRNISPNHTSSKHGRKKNGHRKTSVTGINNSTNKSKLPPIGSTKVETATATVNSGESLNGTSASDETKILIKSQNGASSPSASQDRGNHESNNNSSSGGNSPSNHRGVLSPASNSHTTNDLWVTDSAKKILFRIRQEDGGVTFTLKSRPDNQVTLECPLGVTVHPSGLTLLADRDSDSVLLLDSDGNYIRSALTASDGLSKPCAIYASNKGFVALSQVDGMVKIYSSVVESL